MIYYGMSKQPYVLSDLPIKKGGEGEIYTVKGNKNLLAKVYLAPTKSSELKDKISLMVKNPPSNDILEQIAWPIDTLCDTKGNFVGFIMPKLSIDTELGDVYKYPAKKGVALTGEQKVIIAINICRVISAVHDLGYVFGDFNPCNIGVNLTNGHVAFLDTDSYHITDKSNGKTYRCNVCLNGYVAPELIKKCKNAGYAQAPLPTFTKETDLFALAIHIFKLLMNGFTPYNGIPESEHSSTASPGVGNAAIEMDHYCFKDGNKPLSVAVLPLQKFPDEIQKLFTRAFDDGHKSPGKRPTAKEWDVALTDYHSKLKQCASNPTHYYYNELQTCPYCEADQRYNFAMSMSSVYGTPSGNGTGQMSFSNPVAVPSISGSGSSNGAYSQTGQGQYSGSVFAGGSSTANVSKRNVKGFSHKMKITGVVSLILIILAVAVTLFIDPVIYAKMPEKEITAEYGASIEELGLDVYMVSILNRKTPYDVTSDMVTGYDGTKMGTQEISINCNGKKTNLRVNIVERALHAPELSMKDGLICFDSEPHAESIVLSIDGTEITVQNASAVVLPEEVSVGAHEIKIKFVSGDEHIIDSEYSDPIQIERKIGTVTIAADDGKIVWAKQGSSAYNIVVDGKFFRTVSNPEFALDEIGSSGKHIVSVCIAGDDISTVSSAPSNNVDFDLLPAAVGLRDNGTNLSWEKVEGVDGYDIYVNGTKRLNVGANVCSVDWMKLYAEGGSTVQVVSVGNGKTTVSSALSESIKHTYSQAFKTISSASDLKKLEGSNETFILINDIDMSQAPNWRSVSSFSGKLYGNGHSILNYTVKKALKADDGYVGLVGELKSGALISGLTFENVKISVTGGEKYSVGVIADTSYGTISDCIIKSGTVSAGNCYLGGICGYLGNSQETGAKISNCKNYANIKGQGLEDYGSTGGICGVLWLATISDSDNYGSVSGRDDVGGIFGYGSYTGSASSRNTNHGQVTGKKYIGGIVGRIGGNVQFETCENNGNIGGAGSESVGGIIGRANLSEDYRMSSNSNNGDVVGNNNIGGIIGYLRDYKYATDYKNFTLTLVDLTNTGTINAFENNCGGIVGYVYARSIWNIYNLDSQEKIATITISYTENSGNVRGSNGIGGIIGCGWSSSISNSTISNSKNSGDVNGNLNVGNIIGENTNIKVQ